MSAGSIESGSALVPVLNLRLMREIWHQNPPSLVILFAVVCLAVGYAWSRLPGGIVVLAFGIGLLFGGAGYEIVWLYRRRKTLLEP